jgi:26S proteasome regulatory subunit N12
LFIFFFFSSSFRVGSYHRVISAKAPSAPFAAFMPKLKDAVRIDIANCSEKAYESLSVQDCCTLLFFDGNDTSKKKNELLLFIQNTERSWTINDDRVLFAAKGSNQIRVPSQTLITQSLSYANELEKIV